MRIEHIREFLVLAEELNYTASAKKLYLAQPALSKHIAALEDELGARLLDRSTHTVTLTEAGMAAQEHFGRVMSAYDTALHEINLRADGFAREVRLGFLLHSLDDELYTATDRIARIDPRCKTGIVFKEADELIDELTRGTIDACLMMNIGFPSDADMVFDVVGRHGRSVIVLETDPLAQRTTLHYEDLAARTIVFPRGEDDNTASLIAKFDERGLPRPTAAFSSQKSTQLFTMREVNGVAVVSYETNKRLPPGVRMIELDEPDAFIDICWVYRREIADVFLKDLLAHATGILRESGEL